MNIEELLGVVSNAAKGMINTEKVAIGFNGFGFVFKDLLNSNQPYVKSIHSSKFCTLSFHHEIGKKWDLESMEIEEKYEILIAGRLKTLVPTLKFGGNEVLFDVWMFVRTPDGRQFPATFYYGQGGSALGGWSDNSSDKLFSEEFKALISFNPFSFSRNEVDVLVKALQGALGKVTPSDFYGVYSHEEGNTLMGIRGGRPFTAYLYGTPNEKEIRDFIDRLLIE